jgi:predicted ATP-binding protein involved in virulence
VWFSIHRDRGLVFQALNGSKLPITSLSSGEQHLIVLLHGLLFQLETNSLVLSDEPELSLHLLWEQPFLDDLLKIAQLAQVDVLVATHSPDIIGAHWNLTEALKGPNA